MVDFAIYLRPQYCADGAEAVKRLRDVRAAAPELSANQTGMEALREGPITVSIETKRHGEGADKAELQIGIWQAAQWKMLAQQAAKANGSLRDLAFLPCLLVDGHEWSFAASSREGTKTVGSAYHSFFPV